MMDCPDDVCCNFPDPDRLLQSVAVKKRHYPLPCNANMEGAKCVLLVSLLLYGRGNGSPLAIPCGTRPSLRPQEGLTLDLPGGVRVEYNLHFPPHGVGHNTHACQPAHLLHS